MKNKKILIISIIATVLAILIIGGITFAAMYTQTDMFKTDEQLFYKYFAKFTKDLETLKSEEVEKYLEKINNTPYESKTKITAEVEIPEEEKVKFTDLRRINELNITISGKTDRVNNLKEQTININYSDNITFPIEYRQTGDLVGITSDLILKQYIAVNKSNLQDLVKEDSSGAKIINKKDINMQEIKNELLKFGEIIYNNLQEKNFSKIEEEEKFILTLNEKEASKIYIEILEELEKSNLIQEEEKEELKKEISKLKEEQYGEEECLKVIIEKTGKLFIELKNNISINIQKINNKLTIEILNKDKKTILDIEKIENEKGIEYEIKISTVLQEGIEGDIYTKLLLSDIYADTVKENLDFGISVENKNTNQKLGYNYKINGTKTFSNNVQIETINSQNVVILNNVSEEYRNGLINMLGQKIAEVNKEQMNRLGLRENENPLIYATPMGYYIEMSSTISQAIESTNKQKQAEREEEEKASEMMKSLDSTVKDAFNSKFTAYQGERVGSAVKSLLSTTISNNLSSEIKVSVNSMKDQYKITNYMNNIDTRKVYDVNLKINQYGYINEIEIKEK